MLFKTINNDSNSKKVECLVSSGAQKANKEIGLREGGDIKYP